MEVRHPVLVTRWQILHVGPDPRKVFPPQTEGAVLRGRRQHGAGGVPGDPPHAGLARALDGLRGQVLEGAIVIALQRMDLSSAPAT